ncbi:hypothetical protein J2W32_006521 [Variovorax boronicumulans]|uniref:TrfB transcriptional repressor protein domain-containing protein n=1 Tax=Variovorax boronicumulans TaxID=436515 RepID=A0AAW8D3U7_9BURK|nr:hypothetical protein [Variovorax boronicumulans]MDP9897414.1 hypothetical protein [Variovorax boronicumulans]MDQ0057444.1 hypothetical protein [Variovorax boronicumulans]
MRKQITSPEFAAAAEIAKVSADRVAVARSVLVEGKTYSQAVKPYGWTRQAAYAPIRSIEDGLARFHAARKAEAAELERLRTCTGSDQTETHANEPPAPAN